jgi:hypothetical protein
VYRKAFTSKAEVWRRMVVLAVRRQTYALFPAAVLPRQKPSNHFAGA